MATAVGSYGNLWRSYGQLWRSYAQLCRADAPLRPDLANHRSPPTGVSTPLHSLRSRPWADAGTVDQRPATG
eukprot:1653384-Lingulodinium_polyedra.AAC.1